jgi:hypothetical protein
MSIIVVRNDDGTEELLATMSDISRLREHSQNKLDDLGIAFLRDRSSTHRRIYEIEKRLAALHRREITDPELLAALADVKRVVNQLADIMPGRRIPEARPLTDFPLPPEKLP